MKLPPRPVGAVPFAAFLVLMTAFQPAACQKTCEDWNTVDFFLVATPSSVERCLNAGADPNARDEDGVMPVFYAAAYSTTPAVMEVLLDAGVNVDVRGEHGVTPLHFAAGFSTTPAVMKVLLDAGADPNARDEEIGLTPLHLAARRTPSLMALYPFGIYDPLVFLQATPAVVEVLLNAGADPNARDEVGGTPLHEAVNSSLMDPSFVEFMLQIYGLQDDARWRMLPRATTVSPTVVQLLLDAGADPSARDNEGNTPFDLVPEETSLRSSDVYRQLNEGRFE